MTVIVSAPILEDQTPNLDLHAGTLSFEFDVDINASSIIQSEITITDSNNDNNNGVTLAGARLPMENSTNVVLYLTENQRQAITLLKYGT